MVDREKTRLAVIGVGALGRHHARILSQMPDVELVAVVDASQQQAQTVAEACQCDWTTDYRTLWGKVDAVSLVVPTTLHRPIAEDFLCRDIPVLVEKPLTANVDDGAVLVRIAKEHQIALQVGHVERFNPAFQALADRAGAPKYIRAERMSPYAFRSMDIGVIHDLMIHDIELVLSLVNEMPLRADAFGVSLMGGHEDCVQARLVFPGGCIADLVANRVSPQAVRSIQCWSDKGCATADLQARTVTCFSPGEATLEGNLPFELVRDGHCTANELKPEIFSRFIAQETFQASDADALTAELRSFLDCVRNRQTPVVDGAHALSALQVAERIMQSVARHRWDGHDRGRIGPDALLDFHVGDSQGSQRFAA